MFPGSLQNSWRHFIIYSLQDQCIMFYVTSLEKEWYLFRDWLLFDFQFFMYSHVRHSVNHAKLCHNVFNNLKLFNFCLDALCNCVLQIQSNNVQQYKHSTTRDNNTQNNATRQRSVTQRKTRRNFQVNQVKARYSFTTVRAPRTKDLVICARSKKNVSIFRYVMTSEWPQKAKLTMILLAIKTNAKPVQNITIARATR